MLKKLDGKELKCEQNPAKRNQDHCSKILYLLVAKVLGRCRKECFQKDKC